MANPDRSDKPAVAVPIWAAITIAALERATGLEATRRQKRFLPYCLHRMDNSPARCVVNRWYKPVGSSADLTPFVDYHAFTGHHVPYECFEILRAAGVVNNGGWFYKDDGSPWLSTDNLSEYRRKMKALLAITL